MPEKYSPRSDDPWDKEKEDNLGENEKEEKKKHWSSQIRLSNHAEPTIIIALISAIFYIFISDYYISYFNRLSIPFYTLDLSLTFYLYAAKQILLALFIMVSIIYLIDSALLIEKNYSKNKSYRNLFCLIVCWISLIVAYVLFLSQFKTESIIYKLIPPIFYIFYVKSYEKRNQDRVGFIFMNIFLIYVITFLYIPILGDNSAEDLIRGSDGNLEIKLELKDNESSLPNGTLILVTHSNNKYFLVEKNESNLGKTNLYIIPDDQIKMVLVKPVENKAKPIYEFNKNWRLIWSQRLANLSI